MCFVARLNCVRGGRGPAAAAPLLLRGAPGGAVLSRPAAARHAVAIAAAGCGPGAPCFCRISWHVGGVACRARSRASFQLGAWLCRAPRRPALLRRPRLLSAHSCSRGGGAALAVAGTPVVHACPTHLRGYRTADCSPFLTCLAGRGPGRWSRGRPRAAALAVAAAATAQPALPPKALTMHPCQGVGLPPPPPQMQLGASAAVAAANASSVARRRLARGGSAAAAAAILWTYLQCTWAPSALTPCVVHLRFACTPTTSAQPSQRLLLLSHPGCRCWRCGGFRYALAGARWRTLNQRFTAALCSAWVSVI